MLNAVHHVGSIGTSPRDRHALRRLLFLVALLTVASLAMAVRADAGSLYYTFKDSERIGRVPTSGTGANHSYMVAGNWQGNFKVGPVAVNNSYLFAATIGDTTANEGLWQWSPSGYSGLQRIYYLTKPTAIATIGTDLYWAEAGGVNRIGRRIGSTELKTFITTGITDPGGLAVDATYIYWTNTSTGTIGRAKRDGTDVNPSFIAGTGKATGLTVNGTHVFWANENDGSGTTIGRANLDGTGANQSFVTGANAPHEVAVDGQYLYWTNSGGSSIGRANLDGTSINQSFISTPAGPLDLAIDATKRSTAATIDCTPATPMTYHDSTCKVTVKDIDAGTKEAPTGTVSFTDNSGGQNYFNPSSCTLANPTADSASCTVVYKPTLAGTWLVASTWEGSTTLAAARGSLSQTVGLSPPAGNTTTDFTCLPAAATVEAPVKCTFTVTDTRVTDYEPPQNGPYSPVISGVGAVPSGTQRVFVPSKGSSPSNADCQLTPISDRASECVVYYYPPAEGTDKLSARYDGVTGRWNGSPQQEVTLTVAPRQPATTTTSIDCGEEQPVAGTPMACLITVEDIDFRFSRFPLGVVEITDGSGGTLKPSSGSCPLNPSSVGSLVDERGARSTCRIVYTPARSGASQLSLEYAGDGSIHAASTVQLTLDVAAAPGSEPPPVVDPIVDPPVPVPPLVLQPPVVIAPPPASTVPFSLARLTASQRTSLARSGRVTLTVTVPSAGRVTGKATARIGKRSVSVGSLRATAKKAGKQRVQLALSKRARSALRKSGRLPVTIEVRFGSARKTTRVTLKRAKAKSSTTSSKASR